MAGIWPKVQGNKRDDDLREKMIAVNRVTRVVKGGWILGFAVLAVVDDGDGHIGMDKGKVKEVPVAVQEVMDETHHKMVKIPLKGNTLQHEVVDKHGTVEVQMVPARDGTGVITGDPMRTISEMMGVTNIVAKSHGSINSYNMVRAALDGLRKMSTPTRVAAKRSRSIEEILG